MTDERQPWWFRHTLATLALALGLSTIVTGFAVELLVPGKLPSDRYQDWARSGPCYTCGHAKPMTLFLPDGTSMYIVEPGSVTEMGLKYCPIGAMCTYQLH